MEAILTQQRTHYSSRFGRNFQDDDQVLSIEALKIVAENTGPDVVVPSRYLSDLVDQGVLPPPTVLVPRKVVLYLYANIKGLVYRQGSGRRRTANPSPNALRARAWRERHGRVKHPHDDEG
jgi:hypothetical protein